MEEGISTTEVAEKESYSGVDAAFNPFSKVGKDVTNEQLDRWNRMNLQSGGLVEVQEDPNIHSNLDLLASLSVSEDPEETTYNATKLVEITLPSANTTHVEVIVPSTSGYQQADHTENLKLPPNELVMQYLSGQLSFLEFKDLLDSHEPEKDLEVENSADFADETLEVVDDTSSSAKEDPDYLPSHEDAQKAESSGGESPRKRRRGPRKSKREVPKAFAGLMGEANIKFARGENDEAVEMCMEIIKEAPRSIQPYQTLAMIYETMGDMQKSLEFNTLAAYLNPRDCDSWVRVAEMSLELNNTPQAINAFTQAIKADQQNSHFHLERAKLYEEIGEVKKAMEGYRAVLNLLPPEEGTQYMDLARSLSESYFKMGERETAIKIMRTAFSSHQEQVTSEDVNVLLEMQMSEKMYLYSVEVLVSHCGVSLVTNNHQSWNKENQEEVAGKLMAPYSGLNIQKCVVPDLLPIDLRVKLAVCLIHFKQEAVVPQVIGHFLKENPDEMGDLFLDLAEAYMDNQYYKEALLLLNQLVHSENYNLAAVWLRFADCLSKLGKLEESVQAYSRVVDLAPSHVGARMSLASLQQQLGKTDEALKALSQDDVGEAVLSKQEQTLLLQKCHLLHSQNRQDEFILAAKQLLFHQFKDRTKPSFFNMVFCYKTPKHRLEELPNYLKEGCQQGMTKSDIPVDDLWDLYVKLCDTVLELKRVVELLEITGLGMVCPYFLVDPRKHKQAEFMCLVASMLTKNGPLAFTFIREMCLKDGEKNQVWNLMNQIMMFSVENKYNRFCMRYLLSHPDHVPICFLNGHNAALSGTYVYALGEYASVLRAWPEDPLIHLCIGTTFVHIAGQKFSAKKHFLFTQGLAFLNNYVELRGECQETFYNLGRALHQLGLTYASVHYYRKVLELEPSIKDDQGNYDLTRDAAYNLMLIYRGSESTDLVHQIVNKYLVI